MNTRQPYWRKRLASVTLFSFVFAQLVPPAYAVSTDISDVPMAVKNTVGPNIMFTLDDSGSMQWEALPEKYGNIPYNGTVYFVFPRPATVYGGPWGFSGADEVARFDLNNKYARFYRTAKFNGLYYDPAKRYVPWTNHDTTLMSNSPPATAWHNPYKPAAPPAGEGWRDLTGNNTQTANWTNNTGGPTLNASVTFWPATYFKWIGTGTLTGPTAANNIAGNFTKVEIGITALGPKDPARTDCAGSTCTNAEEIQNFANWYSYYRSRILLARAGVGQAFATVGTDPRIGFAAINYGAAGIDGYSSLGTIVSGVRKFDAAGRANFYASLYGHVMPSLYTPLRRALDDVGQYFEYSINGDRGPWSSTPGTPGGTQASCRQNYNILMTDGYWTEGAAPYQATTVAARANVDGTNGPIITNHTTNPNPATYQYIPANPYRDSGSNSWSNTLADVAMYYWVRDLRPDLINNVPTNSVDPAFWQHLVNYTVGLGVSGTGTPSLAAIQSAFTSTPQTINWPNPLGSDPPKSDDLAHAAVNSRGGFLDASDPTVFASALSSAVNSIIGRDAAAAAVAIANPNVTSSNNTSFVSSFNPGTWSGELEAFPIDLKTGQLLTTSLWTAQTQLDARTTASRKIATYTGIAGAGQGIQFQPTTATTATKLSTAQQNLLNSTTTPPGLTDGAAVVDYLRGDRSGETNGTYRSRFHLLGDTVHAEPIVVHKPDANYADAGYSAFKTANAGRPDIVVQGANDGMVHAFNALTGAEEWAYVPNLVMANLNNLSLKNGFTHKYYVDGAPVAGDVNFNNTAGISQLPTPPTPDWRTIVVGGLAKGGRGYYALDVTTTTAGSDADAAAKVLWEFPNSATDTTTVKPNIGYSYGRPIIVKTRAQGWVVLVTSGYNNGTDSGGTGQGYLFVLNAKTGDVISKIGTGVGSATDPSGLAFISGYVVARDVDNTVDYVYGGDLLGNVWRFDLTDASNVNNWSVTKLAALVDAATPTPQPQPVTTEPELANVRTTGGVYKRFVYVGTGRYLGDSDVTGSAGANSNASQTQTMYGLVDDLSATPLINPLRGSSGLLVPQTFTVSGSTRTASSNPVNFTTQKGWYIDLPALGERVDVHPALAFSALVFNTNIPSTDPCLPGGSSYINVLDYQTGASLPNSLGGVSSLLYANTLSARPILVQLPNTGQVVALNRLSNATTATSSSTQTVATPTTARRSWRELMQ